MTDKITTKNLWDKFYCRWPDYDHEKGEEPALRIYRAITWVERAEKEVENAHKLEEYIDLDAKFIFYWIAFNAAYGRHKPISWRDKSWELDCIEKFLDNVLAIDVKKEIDDRVWNIRSSNLGLMENRYIFRDLWNFHRADTISV